MYVPIGDALALMSWHDTKVFLSRFHGQWRGLVLCWVLIGDCCACQGGDGGGAGFAYRTPAAFPRRMVRRGPEIDDCRVALPRGCSNERRRHASSNGRMLEAAARFSLLAFGIPGFAPDEHLPGYSTEPLEPP